MVVTPVLSWGRAHRFEQQAIPLRSDDLVGQLRAAKSLAPSVLAYGQGRSYGDVALNENGLLLQTKAADLILKADWEQGIIRAQAGLTIADLLSVCVPRGWFMPVTPGSKFVSLGGAVANDVHGKNHHKAGSLGAHIEAFELIRSDGETLVCSRQENSELFALTLGGLGLTGLISWVEVQLLAISSSELEVENLPYDHLDDFFALSEESHDWAYTVAWVDCFAPKARRGRGIFSRANWAKTGPLAQKAKMGGPTWPIETPGFLLNKATISAFNWAYRVRPAARFKGRQHYEPFMYPLDSLQDWNKFYGRKGFFQHQCLIPMADAKAGIDALLETIDQSGQGSFLAVLKTHTDDASPGLLSFCREGVSLALDFANKGAKTRALLATLDDIVMGYGGRLYPAKDGTMSPRHFQQAYSEWTQLEAARDPAFSSSFWRRVTGS